MGCGFKLGGALVQGSRSGTWGLLLEHAETNRTFPDPERALTKLGQLCAKHAQKF